MNPQFLAAFWSSWQCGGERKDMEQPFALAPDSSDRESSVSEKPTDGAWRDYVNVVKPGITVSNMLTTFTGLWLAAHGHPDIALAGVTLVGGSLVVMSGCALNNYMDRDIDQLMPRTQDRPLPKDRIPAWKVMTLGIALGVVGISLLGLFATILSAWMALIGLFFYVIVYTGLTKRTTTLSTVIGGVSGAMPPLIGWTAVTGSLNITGLLLFVFMFLWQPPHFLALAMRRVKDYAAAGIPLLPVVYGFAFTKRQIAVWTAALVPSSLLLYGVHAEGIIYLLSAVVLGGIWLYKAVRGFKVKDEVAWATDMFRFSLIYLTGLSIAMIVSVR